MRIRSRSSPFGVATARGAGANFIVGRSRFFANKKGKSLSCVKHDLGATYKDKYDPIRAQNDKFLCMELEPIFLALSRS